MNFIERYSSNCQWFLRTYSCKMSYGIWFMTKDYYSYYKLNIILVLNSNSWISYASIHLSQFILRVDYFTNTLYNPDRKWVTSHASVIAWCKQVTHLPVYHLVHSQLDWQSFGVYGGWHPMAILILHCTSNTCNIYMCDFACHSPLHLVILRPWRKTLQAGKIDWKGNPT